MDAFSLYTELVIWPHKQSQSAFLTHCLGYPEKSSFMSALQQFEFSAHLIISLETFGFNSLESKAGNISLLSNRGD